MKLTMQSKIITAVLLCIAALVALKLKTRSVPHASKAKSLALQEYEAVKELEGLVDKVRTLAEQQDSSASYSRPIADDSMETELKGQAAHSLQQPNSTMSRLVQSEDHAEYSKIGIANQKNRVERETEGKPSGNLAPAVQAIGMASDAKYYAMVNGSDDLVYEGAVIQGYTIKKIHPDGVEFEKDGEIYLVKN